MSEIPTRQLSHEAQELGSPAGEQKYWEVVKYNGAQVSGSIKERVALDQETASLALGAYYGAKTQDLGQLEQSLATAREVTGDYAKSKAAKIIKALIDDMALVPDSTSRQIAVIESSIDWAIKSNRGFLRQGLQVRLLGLLYDQGLYQRAIELANKSLKESKQLDDKIMLVEVQSHEARIYHALRNSPKARASLTSARTSANAIYTPTLMQAQLDMMSGVSQSEDGDYKTAFSYFYEAFEGYASSESKESVKALKYSSLVKIMSNLADDVEQLLQNKTVKQYSGRQIDAMTAMSRANNNRSLKEFDEVSQQYDAESSRDTFIRSHFAASYDKSFQENLMKIIEPYSCVEVTHLGQQLGLDAQQIEGKSSQMISDNVFSGVLDQGKGWLYVYPAPEPDRTYAMGLETSKHMSTVVDTSYEKAAVIN